MCPDVGARKRILHAIMVVAAILVLCVAGAIILKSIAPPVPAPVAHVAPPRQENDGDALPTGFAAVGGAAQQFEPLPDGESSTSGLSQTEENSDAARDFERRGNLGPSTPESPDIKDEAIPAHRGSRESPIRRDEGAPAGPVTSSGPSRDRHEVGAEPLHGRTDNVLAGTIKHRSTESSGRPDGRSGLRQRGPDVSGLEAGVPGTGAETQNAGSAEPSSQHNEPMREPDMGSGALRERPVQDPAGSDGETRGQDEVVVDGATTDDDRANRRGRANADGSLEDGAAVVPPSAGEAKETDDDIERGGGPRDVEYGHGLREDGLREDEHQGRDQADESENEEESVARLQKAVLMGDTEALALALSDIIRFEDYAVPHLRALFADASDIETRAAAAVALARIGTSSAVQNLTEAVAAEQDSESRNLFGKALRLVRDPRAFPDLLDNVCFAGAEDPVGYASAGAISAMLTESMLRGLVDRLELEVASGNNEAGAMLGDVVASIDRPEMTGRLLEIGSTFDVPAAMPFVARGLARIGNVDAVEGLIEMADGAEPNMQDNIVRGLAEVHTNEGYMVLQNALVDHADGAIGKAAAIALARNYEFRGIEHLENIRMELEGSSVEEVVGELLREHREKERLTGAAESSPEVE